MIPLPDPPAPRPQAEPALPTVHQSVLLQETAALLATKPGDALIDATFGGGGHSKAVAESVGGSLTVIGIDADPAALERAGEALKATGAAVHLASGNFRDLDRILGGLGVSGADRILFDLGISSDDLELSGRGFSFRRDEPLIMTLAPAAPDRLDASDIVNGWNAAALEAALTAYADERYARRIAEAIVEARKGERIASTFDLVRIIEAAVPRSYSSGRTHPATRTFQALRIAVNDELSAIEEALPKAWALLRPSGRIAVISFHSLEDRIAKRFFRERAAAGEGALVTKKPVTPSADEIRRNPRSRSAKLRVIEKLP